MNERRHDREELGLSQTEAAARAGVSLATWRRWEENPRQVRQATRKACERVLNAEAGFAAALREEAARVELSWGDCPFLTPRQAYAIVATVELWSEVLREWLRNPASESLHEVMPLDGLDVRVLILVNENRAWVEALRQRCLAVADEMKAGVLPFDRPGCFADELLMALALPSAAATLTDTPELFDDVKPRIHADAESEWTLDNDWESVSDSFDDRCRWDEWEVPVVDGHPLLATILREHHPYSWFDPGEGSGAGHLQALAGLTVREQ